MTENELYTLLDKHRDALTDRKALYSLLNEKFPNETEKISLLLFSFNIGIVGEIQKSALNDRFVARLASKLVASYDIEPASAEWSILTWIRVYGQRMLKKHFVSAQLPNNYFQSDGETKAETIVSVKPLELLSKILNDLNQLWAILDVYNTNNQFDNYSAPILFAQKPVEKMITLLAYENNYVFDSRGKNSTNGNDPYQKQIRGIGPLSAACSGELQFLFADVAPVLFEIRKIRNKAAHLPNTSYENLVLFSAAFDNFVSWFILKSSTLKSAGGYASLRKFSAAKSMSGRITLHLTEFAEENGGPKEFTLTSSIPDAIRTVLESIYISEDESILYLRKNSSKHVQTISSNSTSEPDSIILERLDELQRDNKQIYEWQARLDKRLLDIEIKIDKIADTLTELSKRIETYQSLVERQIELAVTEAEIDRIVNAYADECTGRMVREITRAASFQNYESEKMKLIQSLGAQAWDKLDPSSQNFLITAKVTYNHLVTISNAIDYSGVCLLVTKAIEVEMNNRFCRDFLSYLKAKYPGKANYCEYPSLLLRYGKPIRPKDFTLGSVAFVLCYNVPDDISATQAQKNHDRLIEFVSERLMTGIDTNIIEQRLEMIAQGVEDVSGIIVIQVLTPIGCNTSMPRNVSI